jgi:hypothetical protein
MGPVTEQMRSDRKPAVLWTPWGPIPKGDKARQQVKSRWLPNAIAQRPNERPPGPASSRSSS